MNCVIQSIAHVLIKLKYSIKVEMTELKNCWSWLKKCEILDIKHTRDSSWRSMRSARRR